MRRVLPILFFSLLTACLFAADQDPARKVAEQVDKHYKGLQSLKADFTESYAGAGVERHESGTLLLKQPGKMRWDYRQPQPKLFLSDGKTAYFYVPGEHQARKAPVKKIDDLRSPLRYLLGKARLSKELDGLRMAPSQPGGNPVITGVPKHLADRVQRVDVEVNSDGQIQRLLIEELDGSTTEFRFSAMVENQNIPDSQFKFSRPEGVEMVEAEDALPQ